MAAHSALSGLPRCIVMLSGGATLTRPTIQAAPCHETGSPGKRSATGDDHSADFPDGGAQRLIRATSLYCYVVGWRYAYPTYNTGRPPCHETGSPGKRSATGDEHSADFPDGGAQRLIRATLWRCYVAPVSAAPPGAPVLADGHQAGVTPAAAVLTLSERSIYSRSSSRLVSPRAKPCTETIAPSRAATCSHSSRSWSESPW
ncbi:Uncharacterised protein [Klebsiella variicola]|nr:Uncharacterised protein [Klebsiella variicola]